MSPPQTFLIVGAGLAGAKAAQTLRKEGFTGHIELVGAETEPPYQRPPLSKAYLSGAVERDTTYVHKSAWYHDHEVQLRLGVRAAGLNLAAHEVTLNTGERIGYDKLLLATGSSPRRLTVPGADLDGVHYLRQLQDADRLRASADRRRPQRPGHRRRLDRAGGGGGRPRSRQRRDTRGAPANTVARRTRRRAGEVFADLHREHGVDLRLNTGVQNLTGHDGRVTAVITDRGDELRADLAVVGVGVHPNVEIAQAAGLNVDNGIVVDQAMRSSDPDVVRRR